MTDLLMSIKGALSEDAERPFSVYTSIKEQRLLNVPIAKPLLIIVLNGHKALGRAHKLICQSGEFIFLSASPAINMRNIPKNNEYIALLIEFDYQDFAGLQVSSANKNEHYIGQTTASLEKCLQQFVEMSQWAPKALWSLRKREILSLLVQIGHGDILSLLDNPQIKDKLHDMFLSHAQHGLSIEQMCKQLAMSESTLRRRLKEEGCRVQEVKDGARFGLALHLLQTTQTAIGLVAQQCGYQSQSRFTDRFKKRFGITPSALRKTKMA